MRSAEFRNVLRAFLFSGVTLSLIGTAVPAASGVIAAQQQQQQQHQRQGRPRQPQAPMPPTDISPLDLPTLAEGGPTRLDQQRVKLFNDDRHKKLVSDVDRLMSLSNELKADVDKANTDGPSVDLMRKIGEIEKLAHDVQNRMKN